MNTQKNVNQRLAKIHSIKNETKQELSSEKVELSIVSDLESGIDEAKDESQKLVNMLRRMKDHNDSIKAWEKTADSLQDDADRLISEASRAQLNIGNDLEAADKSAKELEIDPGKIKGYKAAEKAYDQLEKEMKELNTFKWVK